MNYYSKLDKQKKKYNGNSKKSIIPLISIMTIASLGAESSYAKMAYLNEFENKTTISVWNSSPRFLEKSRKIIITEDQEATKIEKTNKTQDKEVNIIQKAISSKFSLNTDINTTHTTLSDTKTTAGNATISLRNPNKVTSTIKIDEIDVATLNEDGYNFVFQIGINMKNYYNEYLKPLSDNNLSTNASKFTVTFPSDMFDSNLEVDWASVGVIARGSVMLQTANATDGIVLIGNPITSFWKSSSYFTDKYIYVRVPAKLVKDKYDLASEKNSIDVDGVVTAKVKDSNLPDLEFATSYSIPVIDSNKKTLQITNSDGVEAPFENGSWQLSEGTYDIIGTAQNYEGITISGDVTINLNNVKIIHNTIVVEKYAPAISITSGNVNLVLNGENNVEGSNGYAGIYVAPNASLTISGSGILNAKGGDGKGSHLLPAHLKTSTETYGYYGGGAGIGGNGLLVGSRYKLPIVELGNCFGNITINGGTINSKGGRLPDGTNSGAGAGIGAGGTSSAAGMNNIGSGNIYINDGTVNATGGDGQSFTLTGGGAGIGAGGATGNGLTYNNDVKVYISGGTINATGIADGAGIGGGANVDSGIIKITGGTIKATGGYEEEDGAQYREFGAAGIGGGDNGGVSSITITGGTVYAKAIGAAAGIGSGNKGFVGTNDYVNNTKIYGDIYIGGNANVTAIGGNDPNKIVGGAGIGSGQSYGDNERGGFGSISITDSAKVKAYAGPFAQAIGVGSYYAGTDPNKFSVGKEDIEVWLFNQDTKEAAFWGQNDKGDGLTENYSTEGITAIWYTKPNGVAFPNENTSTKAYIDSEHEIYWEYDTSKNIKIIKNGIVIKEISNEETTMGNWATFINIPTPITYNVMFYDENGNKIKAVVSRDAMSGEIVTIANIDKIIEGYTFDEHNVNNLLELKLEKDGTNTLKLYFKRKKAPTKPVNPPVSEETVNQVETDIINPKIENNSRSYNKILIFSILEFVGLLGLIILSKEKIKEIFNKK